MKSDQIKGFDDLLKRLVVVQGAPPEYDTVLNRVNLLERILEEWRFEKKNPLNDVALDDYMQFKTFVDLDKMVLVHPGIFDYQSAGVPPIRLQTTLLMYLLASHGSHLRVYDVISGYTEQIRPNLTLLDFKKTRTGVTRCFTNTRFAANILRDYGFLKFTRVEAYKTWVLSFAGLIVASKVFEENDWELRVIEKEKNYDLHPNIRSVWHSFSSLDQFVGQLESVCVPNIDLFKTFRNVLKRAYDQLKIYSGIVNNSHMTIAQRKKEAFACLEALERMPDMKGFYQEFVTSVNVNKFVEKMKEAIKDK